jgi:hypothetical protein
MKFIPLRGDELNITNQYAEIYKKMKAEINLKRVLRLAWSIHRTNTIHPQCQ